MERRNMTVIGNMPERWKIVKLGDAVEINGASRDPTRENPDAKIFYIDIESVEGGTGLIKMAKEFLGKEAPSRARRIIHQNDVIMSTVRPYLKAFALVPREYNNQICSTGFAVFSCKEEILPRYLLYTLFSTEVIEQCNKMMMGGQYPAINQSQVAKIEIPLPPLPEQRRIAEVLGTVDSAIQKVGGAIESTERLKKGLMQRLFSFKKINSWQEKKFKEVLIKLKRGHSLATNLERRGVIYLTSGYLQNDSIIWSWKQYLDTEKSFDNCLLEKGDLVLNCVNSLEKLGKVAVFEGYSEPVVVGFNNFGLKFDINQVNPVYAKYYCLRNQFQILLKSTAKPAVHQVSFSGKNLLELTIHIPPLSEQRRIAEILSAADRKLALSRRRKEKLERVKKGLMNELLTGRKRVKANV